MLANPHQTPRCLLPYGVTMQCGSVELPRPLYGYKGRGGADNKHNFLKAIVPSIMTGALPKQGQHPYTVQGWRKGVTRAVIALAAGVTRWTAGRRLNRLITHPDAPGIFTTKRQFNKANRNSLNILPGREQWMVVNIDTGDLLPSTYSRTKAEKDCGKLNDKRRERGLQPCWQVQACALDADLWHYPSVSAIIAGNPECAHLWDESFDKLGFSDTSRWIFDPKIPDPDEPEKPLGTTPRLVMAAYEDKGLLDEMRDEQGHVFSHKGMLQIKQQTVADYLGVSIKTVYLANEKLEALGLIRIASGNPMWVGDDYKREPMIVIYLPERLLSEEEAEYEAARQAEAARRIIAREGAQRLMQLVEAKRLGRELLTAWQGREHCMTAYWRELARRLHSASVDGKKIDRDLIQRFIPPLRPDPPPKT